MSKLRCLADRVAVIPVEDPDTYGSIIIPDTAKKRPDQGVIYAVGPEVQDLAVGDHVLFSAYSGTKVALAEEGTIIILPESAVVAWLEDGVREALLPVSKVFELTRRALAHYEMHCEEPLDGPAYEIMRDFIKNEIATKGFEY